MKIKLKGVEPEQRALLMVDGHCYSHSDWHSSTNNFQKKLVET
jgi:hypothetical protein